MAVGSIGEALSDPRATRSPQFSKFLPCPCPKPAGLQNAESESSEPECAVVSPLIYHFS